MPFDIHTLEAPDGGANFANQDRVILATATLANGAGGSAGASVTVSFATQFVNLPASYAVLFDLGQDAIAFATSKTSTGFSVTVNPRLAANTLAAGNVTAIVIG